MRRLQEDEDLDKASDDVLGTTLFHHIHRLNEHILYGR